MSAASASSDSSPSHSQGGWPSWRTMAAKAPAGEDAADRLAQPPGPANVLPDLPSSRFRIRCVLSEPFPTLRERIATECREQGLHGLRLSSSFNQDGRVFLVFKQF